MNNKVLIKNTLALYIRMLVLMLISLYTSRVTLEVLGVEDYGIYNIVGGIVVLFTFINGTLATATQRFLSFDIGKGDENNLSKTFSITFWIHLFISIAIIIIAEIVGLWLLYEKLVIPESRMNAAFIVFQFSVLTTAVNITQVPYNASIVAHEKMNIYAYISIVDVVLKLIFILLLKLIDTDKLVLYAILTFCTSIIILFIIRFYCITKFSECHIQAVWDKAKFKELFRFSSWNLSAQIADVGRTQGVNIILNMFYGPALNAARGIGITVNGIVSQFVTNIMTAINPQIVKSYAQGEIEAMFSLVRRGCKYSSFLLLILIMPIFLEIDFILNLWLKNPPMYANIFCRLILASTMINTLSSTVFFATMASGKIKEYQICMSLVILAVPLFVYIGYKIGLPPYSCLYPEILVCILSLILRPYLTYRVTGFPVSIFFIQSVFPVILVFLISFPLPLYLNLHLEAGWTRFFIVGFTSEALLFITTWLLGMTKSERFFLKNTIKKKIFKK